MSARRKDDHVRLALSQGSRERRSRHFDEVRFVHDPLAAIDVDSVDLTWRFAGHALPAPLYINAMTGGSAWTGTINKALGIAARDTGIAIASGSMSAYFKDPSSAPTFRALRENNPGGVIFANLSANATVAQAREAVELLEAQGLQIHLNPVQELVMPEGDRTFTHWPRHIRAIIDAVDVPVIVKEVGAGMSASTVMQTARLGVRYVDVAGNGGTDFARIENARRPTQDFSLLNDWGQSAVTSLLDTAASARDTATMRLASGGIRTPLDAVKVLAMGARAAGVAGGFLSIVNEHGERALIEEIRRWIEQMRSIMALLGAVDLEHLTHTDLVISGEVREYCEARGIDVTTYARRSFYPVNFLKDPTHGP